MYSDQVRVRLSDSSTPGQIRSDSASGVELGFQDTSFTLPPNHSSAVEQRQIFVISDDSDTRPGEDDHARADRLRRNEIRADMRHNEEVIRQSARAGLGGRRSL